MLVAVPIFFIHHVPSKVHINSVIKDIGTRLIRDIDHRFPGTSATGSNRPIATLRTCHQRSATTPMRPQRPNAARLRQATPATSRRSTATTCLSLQPGTTWCCDCNISRATSFTPAAQSSRHWPPECCDDAVAREIAATFSVGSARSKLQDLRFPIDELVEIAARALSPGINDPFTALTCLDWLGAALSDLAGRALPSHLRVDGEHRLRVIAHAQTFASFADRAFGALVQYCAADMVAALRYLGALGEVAIDCDDPARLAILSRYADRLQELAGEALSGYNFSRVRERADDLRRALAEPDYKRRLRDGTAWLGGTA